MNLPPEAKKNLKRVIIWLVLNIAYGYLLWDAYGFGEVWAIGELSFVVGQLMSLFLFSGMDKK